MLRRKDSLRALAAERVGQGEMGGVTRRVLCTIDSIATVPVAILSMCAHGGC